MVPKKKVKKTVGELLESGSYERVIEPRLVSGTLKQLCRSRAKAVTEAKSLLVGRFGFEEGGYIRDIWTVTSLIPFNDRTATNVYVYNLDVANELLGGA